MRQLSDGQQGDGLGSPRPAGERSGRLYRRRMSLGEPELAEALELRDELLMACREVLLGVGTREAAALIAHIDALLDLDDERTLGSQR